MPERSLPRPAFCGGAAVAAALAAYLLLPRESAAVPPVVQAPPPQPAPMPPPAMTADAPAPAPPVSTQGLILYGVSGGGPAGRAAIIGRSSGSPRVVPVGRDYRPGLTVREVGASYAILLGGGQETRLDINGSSRPVESRPAEAAAPSALTPAVQGMDAPALRLGLRPRRIDGRISGFELKSGADLPVLLRAGLRPGDVIVAVNGQAFESEEKLLELPREIAGSYVAEFDVERGGSRVKLSLPVNLIAPDGK